MEAYSGQHQRHVASPEALTPGELKRMILKLRWIGLEREADRLGTLLGEAGSAASVLATPRDTD